MYNGLLGYIFKFNEDRFIIAKKTQVDCVLIRIFNEVTSEIVAKKVGVVFHIFKFVRKTAQTSLVIPDTFKV